MERNLKIGLIICCVVAAAITIPTVSYLYISQEQQKQNQTLLIFSSLNFPSSAWIVYIDGTAVGTTMTINKTTFETWSNITRWLIRRTSFPEDHNETWTGFSIRRLAYQIIGISTFSTVKITASDGYSTNFTKAEIDNVTYWNDIFLAYLKFGTPLDTNEGPVRLLVTQNVTINERGTDLNSQYCVRNIKTVTFDL